LEKEFGVSVGKHADYVAGHSLGEYSALAAAGSFSVSDTARLLRTRGEAMQAATPVGTGAMAALLGLEFETAVTVAEEAAAATGGVCQAANDNAPGQVVVSGGKQAVDAAVEIAKAHGAKRAVLLPVSAPFHCSLMQPAADVMEEALAAVHMQDPAVPLVANVTAQPVRSADEIRENLVKQVTGTVRWRETVNWLAGQGATHIVEIGAGKVLTGMARRMAPDATCHATTSVAEIEAVAKALHG
jgi:[acyl-carrier-protein] S-malonyltransferase